MSVVSVWECVCNLRLPVFLHLRMFLFHHHLWRIFSLNIEIQVDHSFFPTLRISISFWYLWSLMRNSQLFESLFSLYRMHLLSLVVFKIFLFVFSFPPFELHASGYGFPWGYSVCGSLSFLICRFMSDTKFGKLSFVIPSVFFCCTLFLLSFLGSEYMKVRSYSIEPQVPQVCSFTKNKNKNFFFPVRLDNLYCFSIFCTLIFFCHLHSAIEPILWVFISVLCF